MPEGVAVLQTQYIDGSAGRLFVTTRRPRSDVSSRAVLVFPAFGDEMNKTRRMLTVTGQRLSECGIALIVPDLYGTGDSEGEFRDTSWAQWIDDLDTCRKWALNEGLHVTGAIGVRVGALLAAEFFRGERRVDTTVFWQPVRDGSSFVKQMVRVRVIASSVRQGTRESVEGILNRIHNGLCENVSGYEMSKLVVEPLLRASLWSSPSPGLGRTYSINVVRQDADPGHQLRSSTELCTTMHLVRGEPYWNSVETTCNHDVVALTASVFSGTARLG